MFGKVYNRKTLEEQMEMEQFVCRNPALPLFDSYHG